MKQKQRRSRYRNNSNYNQFQGRPTTAPIRNSRRPLPSYQSAYIVNQNLLERQKYIEGQQGVG